MTNTTPEDISVPVFEIDQPEQFGQFFLSGQRERLAHLHTLERQKALVTVYLDDNRDFFLSSVLAVDDDAQRILLDPPNDLKLLQRAVASPQITLSGAVDRIKIQARLRHQETVRHQGREVLSVPLPVQMLRLQRREFFRIETPKLSPLRCKLAKRQQDGRTEAFDYPLHDISGGGICLVGEKGHVGHFSLGEIFADCRLEIPGEHVLSVNLRIREISELETFHGDYQLRLGCEFYNLPGTRLTLIERYIARLERERKARESGLG